MDYRNVAIFTDLDGTLFNSDSRVSEKNRDAIRRFAEQGGSFGISTGRSPVNVMGLREEIALNAWSVVLNGCEAFHFQLEKAGAQSYVDKQAALELIDWAKDRFPQVDVVFSTEKEVLFLAEPGEEDWDKIAEYPPMEPASLEKALEYAWLKMLFWGDHDSLEQIRAHGRESGVGGRLDSVYSSPIYLEYLPPKVNKGSCLRQLRQIPELRGKCFVAIGDYANDVELLQEADVAVAVGNALPEVKAVADHVICTNDEDAIAFLIDELIPKL